MQGNEQVAQLVKRHGARVVARALGVDHKTVAKLVAGSWPRPPLRAKLLEVYGVALASWVNGAANPTPDVQSPTPVIEKGEAIVLEAPATPAAKSSPGEHLDSRAELAAMVRQLRKELERLNADPKATARERAQVAAAVTAAMRVLVKLDGATITISQILRSEHWVRVRETICATLAAHPVALADVDRALAALAE